MGKVWYCVNCGYEVGGRGRCHSCREKLIASDLPALETGDEDDEVGYRIGWWADRDRGRLIEYLNTMQIPHRFEDEELVVTAEDEARVDDLLEELSLSAAPAEDGGGRDGFGEDGSAEAGAGDEEAPGEEFGAGELGAGEFGAGAEAVRLLADAARRLMTDPTDMQADADVAEASAGVFMEDEFYGADAETWAAVGRVTRRLLVALGAEEAMEDEIRLQASILSKLLADAPGAAGGRGTQPAGAQPADGQPAGTAPAGTGPTAAETQRPVGVGTVYEMPEWLPEQRCHLSVLLDERRIPHEWEDNDLVVASSREDDAEALFDLVGTPSQVVGLDYDEDGQDDEVRYHAIEELFNASARLASEPEDEQRQDDLVSWGAEVDGPAPVGMDEVHWLRIINKLHSLCEGIRSDGDPDAVAAMASELHDLLRSVV